MTDFDWSPYQHLFINKTIPAKTTLLREGEIARQAYFISEGCMRLWFNNNGKDITFQFFFEGQAVSSIESFRNGKPSRFSIESLEPCTLQILTKKNFDKLMGEVPVFKALVEESIYQRLEHYSSLFLSHIRDTPQQRYHKLLAEYPQVIARIPQHYIASYLGITPVSLSRIRNKEGRKK